MSCAWSERSCSVCAGKCRDMRKPTTVVPLFSPILLLITIVRHQLFQRYNQSARYKQDLLICSKHIMTSWLTGRLPNYKTVLLYPQALNLLPWLITQNQTKSVNQGNLLPNKEFLSVEVIQHTQLQNHVLSKASFICCIYAPLNSIVMLYRNRNVYPNKEILCVGG